MNKFYVTAEIVIPWNSGELHTIRHHIGYSARDKETAEAGAMVIVNEGQDGESYWPVSITIQDLGRTNHKAGTIHPDKFFKKFQGKSDLVPLQAP